MKKINIFLIILIIVFGSYLIYHQLSNRQPEPIEVTEQHEQIIEENKEGRVSESSREIIQEKPVIIPEKDLLVQINNKNFLEETYMALEYSKVNNEQLISSLKAFVDNNNRMQPADVVRLIEIHEGTFLNRYLKIFVMNVNSELSSVNTEMRRLFYQMKSAYDVLSAYGGRDPLLGYSEIDSERPVNRALEDERTYDLNKLKQGIHELELANEIVDEALEKLGKEDVKIERVWIDANLSEKDILNVLDKTNIDDLP